MQSMGLNDTVGEQRERLWTKLESALKSIQASDVQAQQQKIAMLVWGFNEKLSNKWLLEKEQVKRMTKQGKR